MDARAKPTAPHRRPRGPSAALRMPTVALGLEVNVRCFLSSSFVGGWRRHMLPILILIRRVVCEAFDSTDLKTWGVAHRAVSGLCFLARRHLRVAAGPVVASMVPVSRTLVVLCCHLDLLFGVLCHVRRFLVICRRPRTFFVVAHGHVPLRIAAAWNDAVFAWSGPDWREVGFRG